MAIVHFNVSPGARHGRIEKEASGGLLVSITVDEARALWDAGQIEDCNLAFRRLAQNHDFDVGDCLRWYRTQGG